ncbi:MAG: hypothetical protein M3238_02135, partial [Actinomycetota bacterium]|nr:hypothetical protein [Actinomycetota bacterium]
MAWTVLLLSDHAEDIRDLLPTFPLAPYEIVHLPLKDTETADLTATHPDLILIDATHEIEVAEVAAKRLALAWEIGLPPILIVVDEDGVARFRFEIGVDDFILTDASAGEISARLDLASRRAGHGDDAGVLKVGDLTVNPENYQVYVRGRPLDLTYKEFE